MKLSIIKYLYDVLQEFPENLGTTLSNPADDHLWKVNDKGMGVVPTRGSVVDLPPHSSKTAFHECEDALINTYEVALLAKIVNKPEEDDWGELDHMLKYIKGTSKLKLVLGVGYMSLVNGG